MSKFKLETFLAGSESYLGGNEEVHIASEVLDVTDAISSEIKVLKDMEKLTGVSMDARRQKMVQQLLQDNSAQSVEEMIYKPNVVKRGNEYHFYFNEAGIVFDEYQKRTCMFLSELPEDSILKVFITAYPWQSWVSEFTLTGSLYGAIQSCKAKTIFCCYADTRLIPMALAMACDHVEIGEYGSISLEYPDVENWGEYSIYQHMLDAIFAEFVEAGFVTEREYEKARDNHSYVIDVYADELIARVGKLT